ncbi:MAG: radical SAM protein [Vicinamibacteria bacterium]|jgi:MoaA/NifB/PqqE/SkfB family radical SAM enzyme|nr:radical SAM protein [Vicinamibacteria bacterium]
MYALRELARAPRFLDELADSLNHHTPPPVLRCVKIKLTSRCNLRCTMCSYGRPHTEDSLPSERWHQALGELVALGCRKVHFSGGEVFLRPDFLDLIGTAVQLGLKVNLTSNGTLITKEIARRLARLGVNSVSLSLDGPRSRIHDAIRGVPGAFRKTVRAARLLRRFGATPRLRINCVAMRQNYRYLTEMVRLAHRLGAVELLPMTVDEKGARKNRLSLRQIQEYNRHIAPQVARLREQLGYARPHHLIHPWGVTEKDMRAAAKGLYAKGLYRHQPCLAPWTHAFFSWTGAVYPCCMTNQRVPALGDLRHQSVAEIFHGARYRALRRDFMRLASPSACERCDLFTSENIFLWNLVRPRVSCPQESEP